MRINKNLIAAVSYITWIGFIFAIVTGDRSDRFTAHHLNQALVLDLISIAGGVLAVIPIIGTLAGGVINVAVFVLDIMGAVLAYKGSMASLPFIGDIHLIG